MRPQAEAEENAQRSFERNGEDFGARNVDDFVRKAHAFVESPPRGAETIKRANGDVLMLKKKVSDQTLKLLVNPADGLPLPPGWKD